MFGHGATNYCQKRQDYCTTLCLGKQLKKEVKDMLNELDKLFDMLSEIENKLTDLERINSMVIVTCDACENGNDIKYDVSNVMMLIEDQIDMVEETIRSNVSKCNALTRNIQETIKKGDCQYGRTTNI